MPLANNSTGASTGEDYNYSNPATIAGILSPTDGDVYTYGYDDSRKQVVIKKVRKKAQVPHKGMNAHPVYSNNLLDSYQKRPVLPTVNDYLSSYVKQAVKPMIGTQQPVLSWADPDRFKQALDNMSGDLRRGALHGKAGTAPRQTYKGQGDFLPLSILRLRGLEENPVKFSWTHALYGKIGVGGLGSFTFTDGRFKTDRTKLKEDLRVLNKPLGALFGKAGIGGTGGFTFLDGRFKSNHTKLLEDIRSASNFRPSGALHGKAGTNIRGTATTVNSKGVTLTFKNLLNPTVRRYEALRDNPILGSHTHALYGMAGSQQPGYSWESPEKFKSHLAAMSGVKTGALHGRASGVSPSNGLIGGLADMLKGLVFGSDSWPMTKFYFYVLIGGIELGFQSVEGLEAEIGVIEYRDGNSPLLAKDKIPGLVTYNKVTLKKGMFASDTAAANLFKEIATDRQYTKRRSILIAMLDHNHIPQFIWRYEGCFITKFTPANLDAESESEIAVEEMEFAGRSFTTETLLGMAAGLAGGAISGSVNLSF